MHKTARERRGGIIEVDKALQGDGKMWTLRG